MIFCLLKAAVVLLQQQPFLMYGIQNRRVYMEQTIAAISTSTMSSGGISIVRLSGIDAVDIADKVFTAKNNKKLRDVKSHTIHYGLIKMAMKLLMKYLYLL